METIKVKKISDDAVIPFYSREGDAAFDLVAAEDVVIETGETKLVGTGLIFENPQDYEVEIVPRSGISFKTDLRIANSPGTIDETYRGEIKIILNNGTHVGYIMKKIIAISGQINIRFQDKSNGMFGVLSDLVYDLFKTHKLKTINGEEEDYTSKYLKGSYIIHKGDKIAQGKLRPVVRAKFQVVDEVGETNRGANGFGSSGNSVK